MKLIRNLGLNETAGAENKTRANLKKYRSQNRRDWRDESGHVMTSLKSGIGEKEEEVAAISNRPAILFQKDKQFT
jgi:hypothetical protein